MSSSYTRIKEGSAVLSPTRSRSQRLPASSTDKVEVATASVSLRYWPSDGKLRRALAGKAPQVYRRISDTATWNSEVEVDPNGVDWDSNGTRDYDKEDDGEKQHQKRKNGGKRFLSRAWKRLLRIRSSGNSFN